jgi:hypothetical protein
MSTPIIVTPGGGSVQVTLGGSTQPISVTAGTTGPQGPPGPAGPEGGTPVVAVPYNQWPPTNPLPNTLYLRLAP